MHLRPLRYFLNAPSPGTGRTSHCARETLYAPSPMQRARLRLWAGLVLPGTRPDPGHTEINLKSLFWNYGGRRIPSLCQACSCLFQGALSFLLSSRYIYIYNLSLPGLHGPALPRTGGLNPPRSPLRTASPPFLLSTATDQS